MVGEEDNRRALSSFRPGSEGIPSGLHPGYLLALFSRKAAEADLKLISFVMDFVNILLSGELPEFAKCKIFNKYEWAGKK